MKLLFQNFITRFTRLINRKKIIIEQYNLFGVRIYTNHDSTFLVKYLQNGQDLIEETLVGSWEKSFKLSINEVLNFQVFITNPTKNKNLKCHVEVNEFSDEGIILNITKFSFQVRLTLDAWKWKQFEVKSILN